MDLHELAIKCGERLNNGQEQIALTMIRTRAKRYRYLSGRNSPRGEIVADTREGRTLVWFNALDVLAFCCANGVKFEMRDE